MKEKQLKCCSKKKIREASINKEEYYQKDSKKKNCKLEEFRYIYIILNIDTLEYLYIGTASNLKSIHRYKCYENIRKCIAEDINYKVIYLELNKDEPLENILHMKRFLIKSRNPKWNYRAKSYNEEIVLKMLVKYQPLFKIYDIKPEISTKEY